MKKKIAKCLNSENNTGVKAEILLVDCDNAKKQYNFCFQNNIYFFLLYKIKFKLPRYYKMQSKWPIII